MKKKTTNNFVCEGCEGVFIISTQMPNYQIYFWKMKMSLILWLYYRHNECPKLLQGIQKYKLTIIIHYYKYTNKKVLIITLTTLNNIIITL